MRHPFRKLTVAVLAAGALLLGLAPATEAKGPPSGTVTVAADHLNNPRQIASFSNALYVAEAGVGGDQCAPDGSVCFGFTGSVTKYRRGQATRVQTGLLSVNSPEGDVVGVDALAFHGSKLFGIATGTCDPGLPPDVAAQAGKVLRLEGGTDVSVVGDASSFECANDPDGQGVDTDPYGLAQHGNTFYVADAAGNDLVKIRRGVTTGGPVLSTTSQPVPTSLAWGPDGALYIGTLNFEGGPGQATVFRFDTKSGDVTPYAEGLTAITGINFDHRGNLYVAEWTTGFGPMGPSPDGDIVKVPRGGGMAGRQVIGAGSVHFPGGVAVMDDGIFVSNWSIAPADDGPFGPDAHGQLIRIQM